MADVTTYKYCIMSYATAAGSFHYGEVRAASDANVTAQPQYWVALTDAEMSTGKKNHL